MDTGWLSGHHGQMEKATVSQLKNELSAYLRKVRAGATVLVYDRDVPIARLVPLEPRLTGSDVEDRLARLEAKGLIRRGRGGPIELPPLPPDWPRVDAVAALIEERESAPW
jgi:prevent-host-death family protein